MLIRTFSKHYREKYGTPVGKIPIDLGVVCPNRTTGGCIFCRASSFTPGYLKANATTVNQIAAGKKHLLAGRFHKYLGYFQQETSTSASAEQLLEAARLLLADPDCLGLILSTRPDYVPDDLLNSLAPLISAYNKECLFELGLQSVHENSLETLNRNHSFADFTDGAARIKGSGAFMVGAHLIFGIPGESREEMLETVRTVCSLGMDALKLHHLQVIRDTPLHRLYEQGEIQLFTHAEYQDLLLQALPLIPSDVVLHRLWATSHPDLLIAPKWNVLTTHLSSALLDTMADQGIVQGKSTTY